MLIYGLALALGAVALQWLEYRLWAHTHTAEIWVAPLAHGLHVQAVAGGKGPAAFLRRLELGSKTRRRAGAAVKNTSESTSSS